MTTSTLAMLVLVITFSVSMKGSNGHPCSSTFFSALIQLIPCRQSVIPFSPIPPSEACCASIKALGQPCLCVLVNGPPISGVDRNMALQLPDKCTANFEPCDDLAGGYGSIDCSTIGLMYDVSCM
ncbi:polygalacturonase [Capsicum annuum]|nr:polygalacturonase [Capsicum annuum]